MAAVGSILHLRWRPTGLGKEHDFAAQDGEDYARIQRVEAGPQEGRWRWAVGRGSIQGRGYEDTPREAAHAAEASYFGPPVPPPPDPFVDGFEDRSMAR